MNSSVSVESLVQTGKLIKDIKILNSKFQHFVFIDKDSRTCALNYKQKGLLKYVQSNENCIFWMFEFYMWNCSRLSFCLTVVQCTPV